MFFNISACLLESFVFLCIENICFFLRAASSFVFFFRFLAFVALLSFLFLNVNFFLGSFLFLLRFYFVFHLLPLPDLPDVGPELKAPFHHLREREKKKRQPYWAASFFVPCIICMVSSYHV
nr:MAG TPA: hypothetical protein [Caudoviricetes sp.]